MHASSFYLFLFFQLLDSAYSNYALYYLQKNSVMLNDTDVLETISRTSVAACTLKCVQSESCFAINMKCEEEKEDCDCDFAEVFCCE